METEKTSPEITCRAAEPTDIAGMHALLLAIAKANHSISITSIQDVEHLFSDGTIDPQKDSLLALDAKGEVIGAAWVVGSIDSPLLIELWSNIHPKIQTPYKPNKPNLKPNALDEWLFTWAERRAFQRLAHVRPQKDQRPLISTICWENQPFRPALLERHDFFPLRYFYKMRRELKQPIPDHSLPAGIHMIPFHEEISEAMRSAYNEIFKDDWTYQTMDQEKWALLTTKRADFFPELCWLALEGDQVIGFSLNHVLQSGKFREGYINYIGVISRWRKRGVASTLLLHSLRSFKTFGLNIASLTVDTNNPTEALGLYQKYGFNNQQTLVQYGKIV